MFIKRSASYYANGRSALIFAKKHKAQLSKPVCSVQCTSEWCALDLNSDSKTKAAVIYAYIIYLQFNFLQKAEGPGAALVAANSLCFDVFYVNTQGLVSRNVFFCLQCVGLG